MTDHLKASPPERYEEISRHLLEQAHEELDKGDVLQASDKVWGATAHAVKAVCRRMGWNHHAHNHLSVAANYVLSQIGRTELRLAYGYLEALHTNYYEHQRGADEIRTGVESAARFIPEFLSLPLDHLSDLAVHLSPLERQDQERRLRMLTRKNRYSHGPEFSPEETAELPPVKPPSAASGESDAG